MAFKVTWTPHAEEDYKIVITYLKDTWTEKIALQFIGKVEQRLSRLSIFPLTGIVSNKDKSIRSIVITKHNKLYYRIKNDTIEILNLFDTRQNPDKNSYE
jgi:plasmid stabilization system protein ParE